MARKAGPFAKPLGVPVAYGNSVFPLGVFPRNAGVIADPTHRRWQARQPQIDGITAALLDTGVDIRGVRLTFAKVMRPK
jgi:hypothetical protein